MKHGADGRPVRIGDSVGDRVRLPAEEVAPMGTHRRLYRWERVSVLPIAAGRTSAAHRPVDLARLEGVGGLVLRAILFVPDRLGIPSEPSSRQCW